MRRYIDADNLQRVYKEIHGGKRSLLIDTEPTVDVVEIVRCKDCKHYETDGGALMVCKVSALNTNDDDFCSYGERADI